MRGARLDQMDALPILGIAALLLLLGWILR
jgi:hypothetical protein